MARSNGKRVQLTFDEPNLDTGQLLHSQESYRHQVDLQKEDQLKWFHCKMESTACGQRIHSNSGSGLSRNI